MIIDEYESERVNLQRCKIKKNIFIICLDPMQKVTTTLISGPILIHGRDGQVGITRDRIHANNDLHIKFDSFFLRKKNILM